MQGGRVMGVYIIAEAGVNHNGSFDLACKLVDAAKKAGVDCIKFQTFKSNNLVSHNAQKAEYQNITSLLSKVVFVIFGITFFVKPFTILFVIEFTIIQNI